MTLAYGRGNPADPNYNLAKLVGGQQQFAYQTARVKADSNTPGPIIAPPPPVFADWIALDPGDPDVILYTFAVDDGSDVISVPVNSLMVLDPSDADVMTFTNLF